MPTFTIDGKAITAEPGTKILDAAQANGIEIPHYCYHPALEVAGSCRMCLVEVDNSPKLVLSCSTEAKDGMNVRTQTAQVQDARRSMLEFFLINHPLDCPICDKAGECLLQDYTFKYGSSHSRFTEDKRERPAKDLGGNILLYRNRCVLCTRCVRFFDDVVGDSHLLVENRGYHSDISIFPGKGLTHKMSGNVVEICPVGCLIDKDFLFHARVWNLQNTRSVCPGCSTGCNIRIESKNNKIYRLRSETNMAVNQYWICDDGRYIYHKYGNLKRLTAPLLKIGKSHKPGSLDQTLDKVAAHFTDLKKSDLLKTAAIVGSAFATNEENFLLKQCFGAELGCSAFYVYRPQPVDNDIIYKSGFTIHADKSPNYQGAKFILGDKTDFWHELEQGKIKTLVFWNGDPDVKLTPLQIALLKSLDMLIVFDISQNSLAELAHIVIPVTHFAEHDGTYVNAQGRVQRLRPALMPPEKVKPGWQILTELQTRLNRQIFYNSAAEIMIALSAQIGEFRDISYFALAESGIQIK